MTSNGPSCTCYPAVKDGQHFNEFIAYHLGECVWSATEISSVIIGFSSIGFWLACQMPQIIKNYRKRSASALSKWFLLEWFLGDLLNLSGALLTKQLPTQLATAVLFIFNDGFMLFQMIYYTMYGVQEPAIEVDESDLDQALLHSDQHHEQSSFSTGGQRQAARGTRYSALAEASEEENGDDDNDDSHHGSNGNGNMRSKTSRLLSMAALVVPLYSAALIQTQMQTTSKFGGADIIPVHMPNTTSSLFTNLAKFEDLPDCGAHAEDVSPLANQIGTAIGWVSAVIYLNSRLPQIFKNYRRKSVEGLSFLMFFCAVMGNTTYGLGVLLRDASWKAINKALPWLVGSLGTLALDFCILLQFWCYNETTKDEEIAELEEADAMYVAAVDAADAGDSSARAFAAQARERRRHALEALQRSPKRGIFGIKAWNTSPFFKPMKPGTPGHSRHSSMPPLNLQDSTSLGVLPSESESAAQSNVGNRPTSSSFQ